MNYVTVPAFKPLLSGSIAPAISATSSTAYPLVTYPTDYPSDGRTLMVYNQGANIIHFELNTAATGVAATIGKATPVPPGERLFVGLDGDETHVVAIATSGPSTTSFTIGSF